MPDNDNTEGAISGIVTVRLLTAQEYGQGVTDPNALYVTFDVDGSHLLVLAESEEAFGIEMLGKGSLDRDRTFREVVRAGLSTSVSAPYCGIYCAVVQDGEIVVFDEIVEGDDE